MARPTRSIDPLDVARVIGGLGGTDEQLAETPLCLEASMPSGDRLKM